MSMMWMRMPGQTWAASATSFLLMWLAMMVAMMLPSALPMLLNFRRSLGENLRNHSDTPVTLVAAGYFFVWLLIGVAVYVLGVAFALSVMHLEWFSRLVPALSGATLVAAGALQFTGWKISALRRCRDPGCCEALQTCNPLRASWHHGLKQGMSCFICCAAPMLALLVLGSMNLAVMIVITAVISMEKLMPTPQPIVRFSGVAIATTGAVVMTRSLL